MLIVNFRWSLTILLIALLKVIDRGMGIISLAMMSQPSFMLKESNHSFMAQVPNAHRIIV